MATKSSNTEAIARATGKAWDNWSTDLREAGAEKLTHKEIAQLAEAQMPSDLHNPEWWAQSVAVAFEQEIGRRLPGQAQDGTFQGSATITLHTDLDGALARWIHVTQDLQFFNGQQLTDGPSISSSERWRYWRASFSDGTKAQVDMGLKGDKTSIAVNITKAESHESVSEWKRFWRQILTQAKG
ncbi:hypothetical protein [Glutamicibacter sp.]|uniref:hypothetical protein n=1 Tax=Glutamicibacter sp. TaxID=1931995 RepID=UPI0028BE5F81|nr:hypothetical protein [Glutamicibacter sp.]